MRAWLHEARGRAPGKRSHWRPTKMTLEDILGPLGRGSRHAQGKAHGLELVSLAEPSTSPAASKGEGQRASYVLLKYVWLEPESMWTPSVQGGLNSDFRR